MGKKFEDSSPKKIYKWQISRQKDTYSSEALLISKI